MYMLLILPNLLAVSCFSTISLWQSLRSSTTGFKIRQRFWLHLFTSECNSHRVCELLMSDSSWKTRGATVKNLMFFAVNSLLKYFLTNKPNWIKPSDLLKFPGRGGEEGRESWGGEVEVWMLHLEERDLALKAAYEVKNNCCLSKQRRMAFFFLKYLFWLWRYLRFSIMQMRKVMTS